MRISKIILFTLIVIAIALYARVPTILADASADKATMKEVKKEADDLMVALKGYSAKQRDEAIEKTKVALDHLDKHIDALETRIDKEWDKMSQTARKEARANLKTLREQRVKLAEWFGRLNSSSADAWEHVKKGFSDAYDTMHETWRKAKESFDAEK